MPDPNDDNEAPNRPNFADTVAGKIFIGLMLAIGGAIVAWASGVLTHTTPPPIAIITPETLMTRAGETVEFTAAASHDPEGRPLQLVWSVGGLAPKDSSVAQCQDQGVILRCRFAAPGTFAVSVEAISTTDLHSTAAATVTVSFEDGYLAVLIVAGGDEAQRALLYDVDWPAIQALISRPIILFSPDAQAPVYAVSARPPAPVSDPPPWRGKAAGLKIQLPFSQGPFGTAMVQAIESLGASPIGITGTGQNIAQALQTGSIEGGFMTFASPEDFAELLKSGF